jgi:hypothetical protein
MSEQKQSVPPSRGDIKDNIQTARELIESMAAISSDMNIDGKELYRGLSLKALQLIISVSERILNPCRRMLLNYDDCDLDGMTYAGPSQSHVAQPKRTQNVDQKDAQPKVTQKVSQPRVSQPRVSQPRVSQPKVTQKTKDLFADHPDMEDIISRKRKANREKQDEDGKSNKVPKLDKSAYQTSERDEESKSEESGGENEESSIDEESQSEESGSESEEGQKAEQKDDIQEQINNFLSDFFEIVEDRKLDPILHLPGFCAAIAHRSSKNKEISSDVARYIFQLKSQKFGNVGKIMTKYKDVLEVHKNVWRFTTRAEESCIEALSEHHDVLVKCYRALAQKARAYFKRHY